MKRWVKPAALLGSVAVLVALLWQPLETHLDVAAFLLRFEGGVSEPEGLARWGMHAYEVHDFSWDEGRARLYAPEGVDSPPGVVLVHGVHSRGIDEARLQHFAAALASTGLAVMTPEVRALTEYRIEDDPTLAFVSAAEALAQHLGHERVGIVGISFSGGLALIAASHLRGRPPIGWVLSVGGHHDLLRVARFYAGYAVPAPDGSAFTGDSHPYGAGVLVYAHVDDLFPPEDVELARRVLRTLLHDRWREARQLAQGLQTQVAQARMRAVFDPHDAERAELGAALLEALDTHQDSLARFSPRGSLGGIAVPVYLVHGGDDPVVPSVETEWLSTELSEDALKSALVTDALRHAEYGREPSVRERWDLVHFMAQVLATARAMK